VGGVPVRVPEFAAEPLRKRPYVWPTWVTKLLAGEDRCWWKAWYKATHKYEKRPDEACDACRAGAGDPCTDAENCRVDFFRRFNERHDGIVNARAEKLREAGWDVRVEDQGAAKISGRSADVSVKPDLVAINPAGTGALVVDAKSGKRRESDHWQVLMYMFALPLSWLGRDVPLAGSVEYPDGLVPVRALGDLERERIVATIQRVTATQAPDATPSPQECKFCDVLKCPVRYSAPEGDAREFF
jgi:CRISPR/Cas system-associated exonuclease Cas4 (RecB family)